MLGRSAVKLHPPNKNSTAEALLTSVSTQPLNRADKIKT